MQDSGPVDTSSDKDEDKSDNENAKNDLQQEKISAENNENANTNETNFNTNKTYKNENTDNNSRRPKPKQARFKTEEIADKVVVPDCLEEQTLEPSNNDTSNDNNEQFKGNMDETPYNKKGLHGKTEQELFDIQKKTKSPFDERRDKSDLDLTGFFDAKYLGNRDRTEISNDTDDSSATFKTRDNYTQTPRSTGTQTPQSPNEWSSFKDFASAYCIHSPEEQYPSSEKQDEETPNIDAHHHILPKRYILLLMMFLGFAIVYSLRVNINVAIVAMVNNRTRITKTGRIVIHVAEFDWDSSTQALVIGSFYYGYWVLQVPGAWIAMKLGGTRIFGYGVVLSSLISLITPVATRYHVYALAAIRIVQGLFLGVTYPCIISIWAKWSPPLERSTMVTMAIAGSPVGNIIAIPLTGLLARYGFDGGWPTVFYFFGFLGCIWYVIWECTIYDTPDNHPTITKKERIYITRTIAEKPFDPLTESPPWCAIFTSIPMWGIIFGHFGACWGYYTLFTQMPTYLKDIQHLDIKTMGLVAAIPYLFKAFLGPLGGISADMLLRHNIMTIRGVRTFFYAAGCLLAGFFILMVGYYVRASEAIAFLILGVGFSGLNATGYAVNHLDIAPRYAGILMGITNSFATIPGFLSPMVTGYITKNKRASEWKVVFWITFIIYVVATALYTLMCSGEKQWWADGYPDNATGETVTSRNDSDTIINEGDKTSLDKNIITPDSERTDVENEKSESQQKTDRSNHQGNKTSPVASQNDAIK